MRMTLDGVRGARRDGKDHDAANRCASVERQQFGAMVVSIADKQQASLFGGRDVLVTAAECGRGVNYHRPLILATEITRRRAVSGAMVTCRAGDTQDERTHRNRLFSRALIPDAVDGILVRRELALFEGSVGRCFCSASSRVK